MKQLKKYLKKKKKDLEIRLSYDKEQVEDMEIELYEVNKLLRGLK